MDETEYRQLALVTEEPRPQTTMVKLDFIRAVFRLVIQVGKLMDIIKREIFYQKSADGDVILKILREIVIIADQAFVMRELCFKRTSVDFRLIHGVVGKVTESAELVELLEQVFDSRGGVPTADHMFNLKEELGDDAWYTNLLHDYANLDPAELRAMNIAKLKARYPDGFNEYDAIARNYIREKKAAQTAADNISG